MNGFSAAQAIIAAMITPALLIMASGSLIATALVRLARVVDRIRKLAESNAPPVAVVELLRHKRRAVLAEQAIALLFAAVLCFVVVGFAIAADHYSGNRLTWLPITVTTFGMCLIVAACAAMLAECRLAGAQFNEEIALLSKGMT